MHSMRRTFHWTLLVASGLVLGACKAKDARLESLAVGIPKDSAIKVMGGTPQRTDPYLTNGQYLEAMYFPMQGKTGPDAVTDRKMSPVIAIDGKLAGWGWQSRISLTAPGPHFTIARRRVCFAEHSCQEIGASTRR